jgi:hypothetical protein
VPKFEHGNEFKEHAVFRQAPGKLDKHYFREAKTLLCFYELSEVSRMKSGSGIVKKNPFSQ